jgi:hypothetical protein
VKGLADGGNGKGVAKAWRVVESSDGEIRHAHTHTLIVIGVTTCKVRLRGAMDLFARHVCATVHVHARHRQREQRQMIRVEKGKVKMACLALHGALKPW